MTEHASLTVPTFTVKQVDPTTEILTRLQETILRVEKLIEEAEQCLNRVQHMREKLHK